MYGKLFDPDVIPDDMRQYFEEVCTVCGKPRERIVEKKGGTIGKSWHSHSADREMGMSQYDPDCQKGGVGKAKDGNGEPYSSQTIGWTDCGHNSYRPGRVLDCFGGSGTTGAVAAKLKRDYILIEINPVYTNQIAIPKLIEAETAVSRQEQSIGQLCLFRSQNESGGGTDGI